MPEKRKRKLYILLAAAGVTLLAVCFLLHANSITGWVKQSIDEDFKITDSLGQVFFVEAEPSPDQSLAVSGDVTVLSLLGPPSAGKMHKCTYDDVICASVTCNKFDSVFATGDGIISACGGGSITLSHNDGRVSVYESCTELVKKGQRVKKGEVIGYASGSFLYKLYLNGTPLDPFLFIPQ